MTDFQLTPCQEEARQEVLEFLSSDEHCMILQGHAGTGKTSLVKHLITFLHERVDALRVLGVDEKPYNVLLTATTHKAVNALSVQTGLTVSTIHSLLGLVVKKDWETGKTSLVHNPSRGIHIPSRAILVIDEASYIDKNLLSLILSLAKDAKIIFMGDRNQLTPVGLTSTPVFDMNVRTAVLSQIVRQADNNPIKDVCSGLREYIETGKGFPQINPDNEFIFHLDNDQFNQAIHEEFSRDDWTASDSRILCWRNSTVKDYNYHIHEVRTNSPVPRIGDILENNSFAQLSPDIVLKTDQEIVVSGITPTVSHGETGYLLSTPHIVFVPSNTTPKAKAEAYYQAGDPRNAHDIETTWADLRPMYASTINKAQGSTYDKVFINLDDLSKCFDTKHLARLLYVGISRARKQVIFTGDIT